MPNAGAPGLDDVGDLVGQNIVDCCQASGALALVLASRKWESVLGREREPIWMPYLTRPQYFARYVLVKLDEREALTKGVGVRNLRLVVAALRRKDWNHRLEAMKKLIGGGRLGNATVASSSIQVTALTALLEPVAGKRKRLVTPEGRRIGRIEKEIEKALSASGRTSDFESNLRLLEFAVSCIEQPASSASTMQLEITQICSAIEGLKAAKPTVRKLRDLKAFLVLRRVQTSYCVKGVVDFEWLRHACGMLWNKWVYIVSPARQQ